MKEVHNLAVFLHVAKCQSFSVAARQMNLPSTTVSRKVQLLEAELNTKLFHRTTRSLSLTEMGERLLPKARLIVETAMEMQADVENHADTPGGRLHIASSPMVLEFLSPLIAEFMAQYPKVGATLETASRNIDLADQGVDFAFRLGPLGDSSLIAIPVAPLRYSVVVSAPLMASRSAVTHPQQLLQWPCIRSQIDGLRYPWSFAKDNEVLQLDSANVVLSNDLRVCRQMVLNDVGVAYLPRRLVKPQLDSGALVSILEDWLPPPRELYLVYTERKYLPSKSRAFIDFVRTHRHLMDRAING